MKLQEIDKVRYRKHLNRLILICIAALIVLSLTISSSMIYLVNDGETSHFWINLAGVIIAALLIGFLLSKYRKHPFMHEVIYVWDLKQVLNLIHRRNKKLELAVEQNDVTAMQIMYFYYKACHQLYTLDDNTITLSSLNQKTNKLDTQIESLNLTITADDFAPDTLAKY